MKLIDLLVQELPKRGEWPDGAVCATQDKDGEVCFSEGETPEFGLMAWHDGDWCGNEFHTITATDYDTAIITRAQYESALAASQKPAWSAEGLPPIGMHCEIVDPDCVLMYGRGESGEVISHVENTAVIRMSYGLGCFEARFLRPLSTEAERKRDAAVEAMQREADEGDNWIYSEYEIIYDAIAAGKIPGVKLDD